MKGLAVMAPAARLLLSGVVLIIVLVAGGMLLAYLKRKYYLQDRTSQPSTGWTIEMIERLHYEGHISRSEYLKLRDRTLGLTDGLKASNSTSSRPPDGDDEGSEVAAKG